MLSELENFPIETIDSSLLVEKKISLRMARLDKIHPIVSGNKVYKLLYFIQEAKKKNHSAIITFGGAYSNHLVATAFFCKEAGIKAIGIVRGEQPDKLSHTLLNCIEFGMDIRFVSRFDYAHATPENLCNYLEIDEDNSLIIPEGGYHTLGAKGAEKIMEVLSNSSPTHICTAVGTGTTLAGICAKKNVDQHIIGVPVLKGLKDIPQRMIHLLGKENDYLPIIWDEYHFGGYAKSTPLLLSFMNEFYNKNKIPTDFVYTAKMMFGVMEKIQNGFFPEGSRIICLHTGGLQGNKSLPEGMLNFG